MVAKCLIYKWLNIFRERYPSGVRSCLLLDYASRGNLNSPWSKALFETIQAADRACITNSHFKVAFCLKSWRSCNIDSIYPGEDTNCENEGEIVRVDFLMDNNCFKCICKVRKYEWAGRHQSIYKASLLWKSVVSIQRIRDKGIDILKNYTQNQQKCRITVVVWVRSAISLFFDLTWKSE